jgi:mono/diheme cytochrome c family protein
VRTLLALLMACPPALACPYQVRQVKAVKAVAVQQIVYPIVPVVAVPVYQISYTPPAPAAQTQQQVDETGIVAELKAIRLELARLRGAGVGHQAAAPNGAGLLTRKCAACHAAAVAEEKGAGFVLLEKDGKLAALSLTEKKRIERRVSGGQMPPAPRQALTEEEQRTLFEFLKGEEP